MAGRRCSVLDALVEDPAAFVLKRKSVGHTAGQYTLANLLCSWSDAALEIVLAKHVLAVGVDAHGVVEDVFQNHKLDLGVGLADNETHVVVIVRDGAIAFLHACGGDVPEGDAVGGDDGRLAGGGALSCRRQAELERPRHKFQAENTVLLDEEGQCRSLDVAATASLD